MKSIFMFITTALFFLSCSGSDYQLNDSELETPKLLKSAKLIYPPQAIAEYKEGIVEYYLLIDTTGAVKKIEAAKLSGSVLLDESAREYSKSLLFAPFFKDNTPVEKWIRWKVVYKLEDTSYKKESVSLLVYTRASGYKHDTQEEGVKALNLLAEKNNIDLTVTEDSTFITNSNLSDFDVILFLNTSGKILDEIGKSALQNFIRNGGGFVGIHSAAATEENWEWYVNLVGATFGSHPEIQKASIIVNDPNHPSTRHLNEIWEWRDEWYNWKQIPDSKCHILLTVDESTYKGGKHPGFHPVAWYKFFEGGRSWYSALGHEKEHFQNPDFLSHILGGIRWTANKSDN